VEKRFGYSLKDHIEAIAIIIIVITTLPVIWKLFFSKKKVVDVEKEEILPKN
jgi:membrane-associated protein